jgi:type IV secretion system protein VirD4
MPTKEEPYPVLFLLDEFASLGRMDVLKDSLAFLAGYRVRICTIVQGLSQLDGLYGRTGRESILQNSALQVFFAANDESTARYVSERLGTKTIQTVSRNVLSGGKGSSKTYGFAGRALLLPEEVRELGAEEALVFKEGIPAVRGRKIRYYRDRAFADRRAPAAEVPELQIVSMPVPSFAEAIAADKKEAEKKAASAARVDAPERVSV